MSDASVWARYARDAAEAAAGTMEIDVVVPGVREAEIAAAALPAGADNVRIRVGAPGEFVGLDCDEAAPPRPPAATP